GKEAFFSTTDLVIPEGTNLVLADSCLVILKDHKLTVNGSVTVGLADGYASMLVYQNENVTLDTSNITVDCGYLFCNSSAALAETYFTQPNLSQLIVKEPYTLSHDLALQDDFLIDFTAGLTVDPGVTVTIPVAAQYKWRHIEFPFGGITVTGGTLTNNGTIHVEAGADISLGEGIPFDGSGTYTGDGIWPGKE
ncbi:MAG: hypothetical protein LBN97_02525, partial [Oscillospiraceae bacterium]|nr:hypothetical protein [Oscillospiraceae bacterium]